MLYFSTGASVKGQGLVNVGLLACGVHSSSSSTLLYFLVFLAFLHVFFGVGGR